MSDEKKPPEELRRQFRLIVGGKSDRPAALSGKIFTLEDLEAMDIDYSVYSVAKGTEEKNVLVIEGSTYEIEYIDTDMTKIDSGVLADPLSDEFIFIFPAPELKP